MAARISEADAAKLGVAAKRRNKFNAVALTVDGIAFASKAEVVRYVDLRDRQRRGEISELECHRRFDLAVNGEWVSTYEADFCYRQDGALVVEDVKGLMSKGVVWRHFRLKARLMKALLGIEVRVIRQGRIEPCPSATS